MKTSKNIKMRNGISVLTFAIAAMLFLGSCQKDELSQPSDNSANSSVDNGATSNLRAGFPIVEPPPPSTSSFAVIKIDHLAARTNLPEYSVTVRSDGIVTYNGSRNVRVKGEVAFKISLATVRYINEVCWAIDFYSIKDNLPDDADLPKVLTSYSRGADTRMKTLFDYNAGFPQNLIIFRSKIESALNLVYLIGDPVERVPATPIK